MIKQKYKLSTIIILFVCLVVLLSLLLTDLLISQTVSKTIQENQEEKAKIVSRTVAKSVIVENGLENNQPYSREIQDYTVDIQKAADVMFVVVMDMDAVRKSHPNPDLIGKNLKGEMRRLFLTVKSMFPFQKGRWDNH
nr:hypothetical protein [Metabacillus litoralis]